MSYPSDRIFEEVAYIARYLHWPYAQVMAIDHLEQRGECVAELEAQPAAVTQVVDAGELLSEITLVHVPRVERVVGGAQPPNLRRSAPSPA